jgi:hypothetical protein
VITTEQCLAGSVSLFGFAMSGLDELLADVEGLSVDPVVSTPAPATRGKSTIGGSGQASHHVIPFSVQFCGVCAFCYRRFSSVGVFWADWIQKECQPILPPQGL